MGSNHSLTVIGSINVDLVASVERLPSPGETIGGGNLRRHAGGKGANQAAAASRLGADVRMIGSIGDDGDGLIALEGLRAANVNVDDVRAVSTPTGTALVIVDSAGENQIVVCPGANGLIAVDTADLSSTEIVLMQLEIDPRIVLQVAQATPGFVALNASPAQDLPPELIDRVDLFIVNEIEYARMSALRTARLVAVTFGAQGAALFRHGHEIARAAGVKVRAVNSVGAGDAFCAALTIALTAGLEEDLALRTACAVGAAAVLHPDSQPPLEQLIRYIPANDAPLN